MTEPVRASGGSGSAPVELDTQDLARLHEIQLELLAEFRRVCEKHGLTFFALYGTLLGAVRHRGFIPWDDDLDVGMARSDYERLRMTAATEVSGRYFFQTCETDPHYASPIGKLRKNGTIFRERAVGSGQQHSGVFIDIFPLDWRPPGRVRPLVQRFSVYVLSRLLMIKGGYVIGEGRRGRLLAGLLSRLVSRARIVAWLDRAIQRYNDLPGQQFFSGCGPYSYEREVFDARLADVLVEMPFEGTTIPAFADADSYLRHVYDDYMTEPPDNERVGHHWLAEMDLGPR